MSSISFASSTVPNSVTSQLLDLLAETGTLTSTQAAARVGHSSGLCSFHLRQLARYGLIEEVPHEGGRARPWRLANVPLTCAKALLGGRARGGGVRVPRQDSNLRPSAYDVVRGRRMVNRLGEGR
ncbi:winged helix-turn-helix domain-containing protein [Streptomyces sp. ISL-87]|nr:winged helix-turn-helix domain-containing protein [Streptomyces sp. ISL-21]MBT2612542.1 winged helix-turn-helix domain-containing protein [Streptomyces sp. ISL-87]